MWGSQTQENIDVSVRANLDVVDVVDWHPRSQLAGVACVVAGFDWCPATVDVASACP
jgi:hypothetical protein